MTSALVITLREGIEAALVLAIILTYLQRTGRTVLNRYVYFGLGLAVLVSIAAGVVLWLIGFDPENEYLEGTLFGIGGIFVASMVLWMWRTAKNLHRHLESRLDTIVSAEETTLGAKAGLLAFTFFMVAREGVETVLFLTAATVGQEANVLSFVGGSLGIGLAVLFAVLFIRGSLKINLKRFFSVTTIVLLILAARLLAGSVHEFAEVGVLPMSAGVMKVIGYFVRDRASTILITALVAVPVVLVLWDFRRGEDLPVIQGESQAERRKRLASQRWERTWRLSLSVATIFIVLAMASSAFAASPFLDPTPQPVSASGRDIRLDTATWQAGDLQKFSYAVGNTPVRFLAAKLEDGSVATSLDACQICGAVGFMQVRDGKNAICKNCSAPIPMDTIGFGGGCNPLPLPSRLEGSTLVVPATELESQVALFR